MELLDSRGTTKESTSTDTNVEDALSSIDHEEQSAGYQASFSRLAASEAPRTDPVAYVSDPVAFVRTELGRLSGDERVKVLLSAAGRENQKTAAFLGLR